jgi:hypothetical protein
LNFCPDVVSHVNPAMNRLPLVACLAVATTAASADPKDPSIVAGDWRQTIEEARQPMLSPGLLGLRANQADPVKLQSAPTPAPSRLRRNGDVVEVPSDWSGDSRMVKVAPGETPPRGAKPWYYRGQKFWIIPIAGEDGTKADGK